MSAFHLWPADVRKWKQGGLNSIRINWLGVDDVDDNADEGRLRCFEMLHMRARFWFKIKGRVPPRSESFNG